MAGGWSWTGGRGGGREGRDSCFCGSRGGCDWGAGTGYWLFCLEYMAVQLCAGRDRFGGRVGWRAFGVMVL